MIDTSSYTTGHSSLKGEIPEKDVSKDPTMDSISKICFDFDKLWPKIWEWRLEMPIFYYFYFSICSCFQSHIFLGLNFMIPRSQARQRSSLDHVVTRNWHNSCVVIVRLRNVGASTAAGNTRFPIVSDQVGGGPGLGVGQHVDSRHHRRRRPTLAGELASIICKIFL